MKKISLVIICQLLVSIASAKSLYMTVRRDFSSQEEPQIEVNYANSAPLRMRILAPKDQKAFIAEQIDLRRAWREPKNQLNPAFYLFQGHNDSEMYTDWIRLGVESDIRKGMKAEAGGAYSEEGTAVIPPGPMKIISAPEGFTVFSEFVVNPEGEDKKRPFDVPGFNSYFRESGLKTKVIRLPKLPNGFYVVQTLQGSIEGQVVLVVNDIMAQMQHSQGTLIYRVANRSGEPISGANIEVRNLAGKWIAHGSTDKNGELELKNISDTELISLVSGKAGTAIIDSEYYATTAVFPDLYLYTDRPMYKSGEKVHFRGILRNLQDGVSKTKSDVKNVTVELQKIDGSVVKKSIQAKVSEFGTFTGTLMLEDGEEGVFRVVASVSKQNHSGEFRVKEYVKPLYFVNVITDQETLKAGDTLKGKLKAERYAGGAPVINKATAELYRVRMETPQWADDAGMGETGSEVTYGYENNKGAQGMLPVLVTSLESIDFDEAGNANFEIKVPDKIAGEKNYNYQFILKFTFVDADENIVGTSKTFYDLAADVVVQAQFNKVVVQKANEASLNVRSVSPSGKVLAKIKGEVEYVLENAKGEHSSVGKTNFQTDDHGKSVLKLPEGLNGKSGDLVAKVKLWDAKKNENLTESSVILAGERSGESVVALSEPRILTNEFILTAKGKARMFMLLPSGWGEKGQNKGNLYVTIAGDKIFSRRIIPVNGLSTWIEEEMKPEYGTGIYLIVSYPDSKQGWIERRSHFRIIDLSKGLKISLKPDNAVVPPGGQQSVVIQVKDQDDKPVKAEVSLTVVDRSVLDMQPEIRPALLDFFYPEVKLNLMTFLSSQFQGYGYGEEIAHLFKANFQMAAVKSQSKVLDQQDTAFWKGDVVTDEKGQAKLQFTMPGNQTIWRMTSVAVDNHGRFGEGQKEFKAQSPVSLLLGYPHFIRKSDKAKIRVNLTSVEPTQSVNVKYNLVSEAPEVLKVTRPEPVTVSLKPKQQFSTDFALTPATEGKSTEVVGLLGALQIGGSQLKLRDTIRVQPSVAVVPEYIFPINNKMNIKLAANESVHSAELQMSTGLASAVVPAMEWMIQYPYGCVEQLVSTTLPNLVMARWLESAEKRGVMLSEKQKALLANAKQFGTAGIAKLAGYQLKDGGFKWFQGEGQPDVNMTLMVMLVLSSVERPHEFKLDSLVKSYEFLDRQNFAPASPQGVIFSYIEAQLERVGYIYPNSSKTQANLKLQVDYAFTKASLMEKALILSILNAERSNELSRTQTGRLAQKIADDVMPVLNGKVSYEKTVWNPAQTGWDSYPGHWPTSISLVAKSLSQSKQPAFDKIKDQLKWNILQQFNGENFGSTWDTAQTLLAVGEFLNEELGPRSAGAAGQIQIALNGKKMKPADFTMEESLTGLRLVLPPAQFKPGANSEVVVTAPANYISRISLKKEIPLDQIQAQSRAWQLTRNYYRLSSKGEKTLIDPSKTKFKVGDLVFAEISFNKASNFDMWNRSRYYVLSESVPAGFIPVQEDKIYQAAPFNLPLSSNYRSREILNDQVRWYYDFSRGWMDNNSQIGIVMRASYPGTFDSGITKIEDFYDETQTSRTQSMRFTVESSAN